MEFVREATVIEYERIRKQVLAQVAKAGSAPMRLASSREMAHEFGVAHTTVARVLRDLASDGILTVKKGIGVFTRPNGYYSERQDAKIIGILFGDGKQVFIEPKGSSYAASAARSVMFRSSKYLMQYTYLGESRANSAKEILSLGLAGAIWITPDISSISPCIAELKEAGFPQISLGCDVNGVSSVFIDGVEEHRKATGLMLDEGRRKVAVVLISWDMGKAAVEGWRLAHEERGLKCNYELLLPHSEELQANFDKTLARLRPDGICFSKSIGSYMQKLASAVDIKSECRLYSVRYNIFADQPDYCGYVGYQEMEPEIALGIDNLIAQLASPNSEKPIRLLVETDIKFENHSKGVIS